MVGLKDEPFIPHQKIKRSKVMGFLPFSGREEKCVHGEPYENSGSCGVIGLSVDVEVSDCVEEEKGDGSCELMIFGV